MGYTETYIHRQISLMILLGTKYGVRTTNNITSFNTEQAAIDYCVANPEYSICVRPVEPKILPVTSSRLDISDFDF
jgi:hypothetical protein